MFRVQRQVRRGVHSSSRIVYEALQPNGSWTTDVSKQQTFADEQSATISAIWHRKRDMSGVLSVVVRPATDNLPVEEFI